MSKFRKKPVVIEAIRWTGNWDAIYNFVGNAAQWEREGEQRVLIIPTLEGAMRAQEGDWIIKGVKGEFYPCKPDIFAATYEAVEP